MEGTVRVSILVALLVLTVPLNGQVPIQDRQPAGSALRPAVMGPTGGVSTGHPLTTAAAFGILLKGGNAFDAGVASLIAGGVLEQDLYSLGGEALVLVYPKKENKVTSIVGQGWAPKAVDVDWYLSRKKTLDGAGLDPAVVPGALHAALTVLEKWGTMSFEEVAAPGNRVRRERLPDAPQHGAGDPAPAEVLRSLARQPEVLAEARRLAVQARRNDQAADAGAHAPADGRGRARGEVEGPRRRASSPRAIASTRATSPREMVAFLQKHGAPFDASDFAEYFARIEEPARTTYRGYTVYKHGFGSQGPVLLQALNILENFDLQAMGYDSADYLHTVTEAMKLAYADRDTYYADPAFVQVPAEGLLSKAYAKERAALIDPKQASTSFIAGDPLKYDSKVKQWTFWKANVADGVDAARRAAATTRTTRRRSSRTPRTWRSSTRTATSSTSRRAAAGCRAR